MPTDTQSTDTENLFYIEYRNGNCSMIAAPSMESARAEAIDFARSFQTRIATVRLATQDDIEDFGGDIYRIQAEEAPEWGAGTHCQHGVPYTDTVHVCL